MSKKIKIITIISIIFGTILEWYDFSLLAAMAPVISKIFFPSNFPILSLLATFGVFASGFLMRPLGGVVFGYVGDRVGRRNALSMTILLMALPTTLIGLLPTYEEIGFIAPVILIALRLIQGFASSGEYPGAICFLTEIAPEKKRGLFGSLSMFGNVGGIFLGSLVNYILISNISTDEMIAWGWRIPFLLGLPLGVVGLGLRYLTNESEIFLIAKKTNTTQLNQPLFEVIKSNTSNFIKVTLLYSLSTIVFYLNFVYITASLVNLQKINLQQALISNTFSTFTLIVFIPIFGFLSDKLNRKTILSCGVVCLLFFNYPLFKLFLSGNFINLIIGQSLSAVILALYVGPIAATSAENFNTLTRYSGIAVALNLGASIFGGTCPLIATYLVNHFKLEIIPAYYAFFFSALSLIVIFRLKNNQTTSLSKISG